MTPEPEAFASVVSGPEPLGAAERALRAASFVPRHGWELPDAPWSLRLHRVVCLGAVTAPPEAEAALLACGRTAGVVVDVSGCPPELLAVLSDDLGRLALAPLPTRRRPAAAALPLSPEQRALLALVADGASVLEAAEQLFLSRRTAERRMASVRTALGVTSTAAAVTALLAAGSGGLPGRPADGGLLRSGPVLSRGGDR